MLDIGWSEIAVIAVVALLVIGPKDLPRALATVGKWVRKARMLAREFQSNVDEMVRQAELEDLRKQVDEARSFNLATQFEKAVDPDGGLRNALSVDDTPRPVAVDAGREADKPAAPAALPQPVPTPVAEPAPVATVPVTPAPSADAAPLPKAAGDTAARG